MMVTTIQGGKIVFQKKLFGNTVEPACEHCRWGRPTPNAQMILCQRNGVVAPYYSCKKYVYDPVKRVPKRAARLPEYKAEDFKL